MLARRLNWFPTPARAPSYSPTPVRLRRASAPGSDLLRPYRVVSSTRGEGVGRGGEPLRLRAADEDSPTMACAAVRSCAL